MRLLPYHVFERKGRLYLVNPEHMVAAKVNAGCVDVLASLGDTSSFELPPDIAEEARRLRLVQREEHSFCDRQLASSTPVVSDIALMIAQQCNLACEYCVAQGGTYGDAGMMDRNTAQQAVDWVFDQAGNPTSFNIGFFGGEPLLNFPVLKATVAYVESKRKETGKSVVFSLVTNGTALTDNVIAYACAHNIMIKVSLDGDQQMHDRQRPFKTGGGSYDRIAANVGKLLAAQPNAGVSATIVGDTDPRNVRRHHNSLGFRRVEMQMAMPKDIGKGADSPPERPVEGFLALIREYADDVLTQIQRRDAEVLRPLWKSSTIGPMISAFIRHRKHRVFCGAGRRRIAITVNGDIYPCASFIGREGFLMGNVFYDKLTSAPYPENQLDQQPKCRSCFARYACGGSCYYENLGFNSSIHDPAEDRCRIHRRRAEESAYITAELTAEDVCFLEENGFVSPKPWYEDLF